MVNGSLAVQQHITKPPFFSNQLQILTKSYPHEAGPSYGIPSKLHLHSNVAPTHMVYGKQQQYIEQELVKTSKYAELYSNPLSSPAPNFIYNGSGVDMYPVDVVNSIPNTASAQKLDVVNNDHSASPSNSDFDLENMFGKSDGDLSSLLSLLTPDNKDSDEQASSSSSYLIPSLELLTDPTSLQQQKLSQQLDLSSSNGSASAFASYDLPVLDNSAIMSHDDQTFWETMDKEHASSTGLVLSPASAFSLPLSAIPPTDDPFMSQLLNDEPLLTFPPDESRYNQAATPTSDIFQAGLTDDHSPPPSSVQSSPVTPTSNEKTPAPMLWNDNLQDMFEKSVDLSDMIELDFMIPPPVKRRPSDELPSPQDSEEWSVLNHEVKIEPASPEVKSSSSAPPVKIDATSERGGGAKAKSTMLFGKHEDEIIHKLLVPHPGSQSKPVSRDKLVSMPVEEFNQLLEQASLTEIEVAFMKEWRRRGKNKAAAQIARKRKREEVTDLDGEVKALRKQKAELNKKYDRLRSQLTSLKRRSIAAEDKVYRQQSLLTGKTVSRDTHLIHLTDDDKLLLVPKISSKIITMSK